ncbi:unnamed protein product [Ectocarpus sp. 8 AP-2014]
MRDLAVPARGSGLFADVPPPFPSRSPARLPWLSKTPCRLPLPASSPPAWPSAPPATSRVPAPSQPGATLEGAWLPRAARRPLARAPPPSPRPSLTPPLAPLPSLPS